MHSFVFLLLCVTSAVAGLLLPESTSDTGIQCPRLPCPLPPCDRSEWIPTYFEYKGKNCTACYQCPAPQDITLPPVGEERLALTAPLCPIVDCFFPPPDCPVALVVGYIQIGDIKCPGCPKCPVENT